MLCQFSGVQQSGSDIYRYIYRYIDIDIFFSIMVYYGILNIVPCAIL